MRYRVEQLAAACDVSVDTVRYYQTRGLLPPPAREGRVAWYGDRHAERIREVRELRRRGLTLAAIERVRGRRARTRPTPTSPPRSRRRAARRSRTSSSRWTGSRAERGPGLADPGGRARGHRARAHGRRRGPVHRRRHRHRAGRAPRCWSSGSRSASSCRSRATRTTRWSPSPSARSSCSTSTCASRSGTPRVRSEPRPQQMVEAFDALLPAVTKLVANHFRRVLLEPRRRASVSESERDPREGLPGPGEEKARAVRGMFDTISSRYDLVNRVMTFGMDVGWRRRAVRELRLPGGALVARPRVRHRRPLRRAARRRATARSASTSRTGCSRNARTAAPLVEADVLRLPARRRERGRRDVWVRDAQRDRPGRLVRRDRRGSCGLGGASRSSRRAEPDNRVLRAGHALYFRQVVPLIGGALSDKEAYSYLPRSIAYLPRARTDARDARRRPGSSRSTRTQLLGGGVTQLLLGTRRDVDDEAGGVTALAARATRLGPAFDLLAGVPRGRLLPRTLRARARHQRRGRPGLGRGRARAHPAPVAFGGRGAGRDRGRTRLARRRRWWRRSRSTTASRRRRSSRDGRPCVWTPARPGRSRSRRGARPRMRAERERWSGRTLPARRVRGDPAAARSGARRVRGGGGRGRPSGSAPASSARSCSLARCS